MQEWDEFVSRSPQGNVFCTSKFINSLNVEAKYLFVEDDTVKKAALPVIIGDKGPQWIFSYQGMMLSDTLEKLPVHRRVSEAMRVTEYLISELTRAYDQISICCHPKLLDIRAFLWFNYHTPERGKFTVDIRYTGTIDLENFDVELFLASIRTLRRREVSRAIRRGYFVEESTDIEILNELHRRTFARQGILRSNLEVERLKSICTRALQEGYGKLLIAKNASGVTASASFLLLDADCAYWFYGANDPDFRDSGAATLLMVESIKFASNCGKKYFDFEGVNSPRRGDFKTSFNARVEAYYALSWSRKASERVECPNEYESRDHNE
jgi:hypothetical protein